MGHFHSKLPEQRTCGHDKSVAERSDPGPSYEAVLSELSMEVARNSDLTPDEVFRRLASLPREMVMDEASRLVDMTSPSLKEVTLGPPTKSWRITSPG